jgi:mono/diheme cytochrome c family protein
VTVAVSSARKKWRTRAALVCACAAWLSVGATPAPASGSAGQVATPAATRTVWDAVYTEGQARRGQAAYAQSCAACHADDLRGKSTAPSLVEESFAFLWGDLTVGALFTSTRTKMPSDKPGSLPPQTYADIVAFLLQKNGFPAGGAELVSESAPLDLIAIKTTPPGR